MQIISIDIVHKDLDKDFLKSLTCLIGNKF